MKIEKIENCIEGGHRNFFIMTCDFSSLQARLASIDTFLNDCPDIPFIDAKSSLSKPDEVLYNVYKDGSDTSDLHSMTGFGTFVESINMNAIRVYDDVDKKSYVFAPISKCRIIRDGVECIVKAVDLRETDHIIEYCKK